MAKLSVALRLLRLRFRRGKKATLRTVQARRLFWPAFIGEQQVMFEWLANRKIACLGGLVENMNESNQPALALMRELHEELGLGPRLCPTDEREFCFHHDFTLESGENVRFTADGWIHIGGIYRLRVDARGGIHGRLPFGMHVVSYSFEVFVYAQAPPGAQRIDGPLPFGATAAWSIRGMSGETTTVLVAPLDPDGAVLQETAERDWRIPPERYCSVAPSIPAHYYAGMEHADGSSCFSDRDPEAKYFLDGEFHPFGRVIRPLVSAVVLTGLLAVLGALAYVRF